MRVFQITTRLSILSLALSSTLVSLPTFVLAAQPDAGQILQQQQQQRQTLPDRLPALEKSKANKPAASKPATKTVAQVKVRAFHFEGNAGLASESELQALVADSVGKPLTFADLQGLAERITAYLKKKGFFLASAYLPQQDVTSGVIQFTLLSGKLQHALTINGHNLRLKPTQLQAIADHAIPADAALQVEDLERAMLLMNDLPGMQVRSSLAPSNTPGVAQLVLDASEGPAFSSRLSADNYGNQYTGIHRAVGNLSWQDPARVGDQLSLNWTNATDLTSGQLDYSVPIHPNGARVNLSLSRLRFRVGEEFKALDITGSAQTFAVSASYPIIRSRALNVWSSLGYTGKSLQDRTANIATRDKQINARNLSVSGDSYDSWGGGGLNSFSFSFTGGELDLSRVAGDLAADSTTAGTQGDYAKLNYSIARLQQITPALSFFSALNGQYAGQNLDSSEKFILGGPSGVRAYPSGEASGDRGEIINLELRYDLPTNRFSDFGQWQLVTFADAGHIRLYDTPWTGAITNISGTNEYLLTGAGIGLNLTQSSRYAVRTAWASQLGRDNPGRTTAGLNSDGKSGNNSFWLQALAWF